MDVTARDDCLGELNALVRRGERDDLDVAQNLILRFSLSHNGAEAREAALTDLMVGLAEGDPPQAAPQQERAFRAALVGMIERTRGMVGPVGPDKGGAGGRTV